MNTYILLDEIDYRGRKLRVTAKPSDANPNEVTVSVEYDAIPERVVLNKDDLAKCTDYRKEIRDVIEDGLSLLTCDNKVIALLQLINNDDLDRVFLLTRQAASPLEATLFDDGDLSVIARPDSTGLVISVRRDPDQVDLRYARGELPGLYNRPSPVKSGVARAVSGLAGPFSVTLQDFQRNVTEEMLQNVIDTAMAVSSGAAGVSMASHPKETEVFSSGDLRIAARHVGDCLQFHFDASFAQTAVSFTHAELRYLRFPEDTVRDKIVATVGSGFGSQHPTTILVEQTLTDDVLLDVIEQGLPKKGKAPASGSFTAHAPATDVYQEICRWTPEKDVGMQPGQPWEFLRPEDIHPKEGCPDCGGTGEIQLFVSTVPCERCRL